MKNVRALLLISWYFFFCTASVFASDIKINEILVHPSSGNHEWVELYNPDKVNLSGYWIDDDTDFVNDSGGSAKKSLTSLQGADTLYPYIETSSMFNNSGDHIVLFDSAGTIVDQYEYTKDPGSDISIGRSPDGFGDFAVLASATKGSANAFVQPSPTLSPTKVPTPTHTQTPTKIPSPTSTAKPTPTSIKSGQTTTVSSKQGAIPQSTTNTVADESDTSDENVSPSIELSPSLTATASSQEAVLDASISATPTPTKRPKTLVKAAQAFNILPLMFSLAGGVCLIACGILVYKRIKN